ncbi:TolC family protein [Gilvimarinus sp. 1_MG-2023]|uniref:TolC family protein n=1 Tax=Gilvimarinus sp. 1_MG-2023 TaxID=3062638 RepID=UPI0026E29B3C|nr:TolC family protein [Gilvimarinus sp. 1_MG-2023]MDO6748045.1 TolC family protein [Gilvimarinus sp. 1_MG-2023]
MTRQHFPRLNLLPKLLSTLLVICTLAVQAQVSSSLPKDGLTAALRATLANHPAIAGKRAEIQASDYSLGEARSQRLPSVSLNTAYGEENRANFNQDEYAYPTTLRVRQPVWTFGRISNNIEAAEAGLDRESADLVRVRRELLTDTALAYAGVLSARARVAVAEQNLMQLEVLRQQIQRRAAGQLASDADTRLADTRLTQAKILLSRYRGEVDIARNTLQSLTQLPIVGSTPIASGLLQLEADALLEERVLKQSAQIQLRKQNVAQARAQVNQTRTSAMPTVYLQAEQFYDQPALRDDSQISVVLEAQLDGLGFSTRNRTGAASARQMAAEQELRLAHIQLQRDIRRLQRQRTLMGDIVESQRGAVEDLQALLDSYQRQYESGSKSWLEVMNIQRELNTERVLLTDSQNEQLRYSLELLGLSGELDLLAGLEVNND